MSGVGLELGVFPKNGKARFSKTHFFPEIIIDPDDKPLLT